MVRNLGSATPGTYGDTARPLPRRDDSLPLHAGHQHTPKPTGLDWDAITPRCKLCNQPSRQLDDSALCPGCGGVAKPTMWKNAAPGSTHAATYETLPADQLEQRFTPAQAHDLETPSEAVGAAEDEVEGAGASSVVSDVPATPTIRAKVTSPSPRDIVITLCSSDPIPTPAVAALLNDLLTGLQTSGVVAEPVERQSTVSTTPETPVPVAAPRKGKPKPATGTTTKATRGHAGGLHGSTGKLTGHEDTIIARYQAGESSTEISRDYDCSRNAILYLLWRNNIPTRGAAASRRGKARRALTDDEAQQIGHKYVTGGYSLLDLADEFSVAENTIRRCLLAQDIQPRPKGTRTTKKNTTTPPTGAIPA